MNLIAVQGYGQPHAIARGGYVDQVAAVPLVPAVRPHVPSGRRVPPTIVDVAGSFAFTVRVQVAGPGLTVPVDPPTIALTSAPRLQGVVIPPGRIITPVRAQRGIIPPDLRIITPPRRARLAAPCALIATSVRTRTADVRADVLGPVRTRRHTVVVIDADTYAWLLSDA